MVVGCRWGIANGVMTRSAEVTCCGWVWVLIIYLDVVGCSLLRLFLFFFFPLVFLVSLGSMATEKIFFESDLGTLLGCTEVVPCSEFLNVYERVVLLYSLEGYGERVGVEYLRGLMSGVGGYFSRLEAGFGVRCGKRLVGEWVCEREGCGDCCFVLVVHRCLSNVEDCSFGQYGLPRYVLRWKKGGGLNSVEWLFAWHQLVVNGCGS